jgi:hypothetical protein
MICVPATLTPRRPELAGTCKQAVQRLVKADPSLTAVAGWYHDALWGAREHWWTTREDGTIVDPTVEQFPTGHIAERRFYEPFSGIYPCPGCEIGVAVESLELAVGFCCGACHGDTIGFPSGSCTCTDAYVDPQEDL